MAWPPMKNTQGWNDADARAALKAFRVMQGWISQYISDGVIPSAKGACPKTSWDYYNKWCAAYYGGFAAEVARLEAEREQAEFDALAAKLSAEEAAAIVREKEEAKVPLVLPDPVKPPRGNGAPPTGVVAALPWGLILAGGAGVLLVSRMMRGRRQAG